MSEEAARKLLADEEFIGKIVEKVYDKLRNDELLKKSDQILKMISESVGRIERIEEENKRIWQEIQSTKEEIKRINERIERIEEENTKIWKEIQRMNISFSSFTSRAGHYIERTIMELYKEALSLHGIDPSAVRHVTIIDEKGVVSKGRKFEVDFYETDDAIYVFEVKNFADEGAVEQLEIREKVFQSLYQKPIRLFLIANTIEEEIKETAESMGITVIAGLVVSS
jgi:hypothetical protein